jgi:methyltransferase-like protein/SAM-dependent methyltransferase
MSEASANSYDEVLYPSALYPHTHPDRLATMATLFGLKTAPVEECRVLELGCGDGANLIGMAYALPHSRFVGIDSAARPIAAGQEMIKGLGLDNISLRQLDLTQMPAEIGPFDFIIAHGLYSWVPEPVRDKLLELCRKLLTDSGVVYISYNAYPGCHFRDIARGMMRYHTAGCSDPAERIRQARALLKFVADSAEQPEAYHLILERELHQALTRPDSALFHDDLSAVNQAVYFHEFIEHAARHELQYLSEANLWAMHIGSYPQPMSALLKEIDPADVIAGEQYNDFVECRPFRRTLLCRSGIRLDRSLSAERLYGLRYAGDIRPPALNSDPHSASPEVFNGPAGAELETSRPLVKAAFRCLGIMWPQSIAFNELTTAAQRYLEIVAPDRNAESAKATEELAQALFQAHLAGCVETHAHKARFVTAVSERPVASALARLQLRTTESVSTLRHEVLRIEDSLTRGLVLLLDGTRRRSALLQELGELIKSGAIVVSDRGKAAADIDEAMTYLRDGLDANLSTLARRAVLVA